MYIFIIYFLLTQVSVSIPWDLYTFGTNQLEIRFRKD